MTVALDTLAQKRKGLIDSARAIMDAAKAQGRDALNAEEAQTFDRMYADAEAISNQLKRQKALDELSGINVDADLSEHRAPATLTDADEKKSKDLEKRAFERFLRRGPQGLSREQAAILDKRALQADVSTAGGYVVPPAEFLTDWWKDIDDQLWMRKLASVHQITTSDSMGAPSIDAYPEDSDWTAELTSVDADTAMKFGRRDLKPHLATKRILVSEKLLRVSPGIEGKVRERLAYKAAITMEKAYISGNGSNRPLGVFTASALGISTGRDVSTDNTTTAVTFDGLLNAKYAMKEGYRRSKNCAWLAHRDFYKMVSKLKDGEGQYLWQPAKTADESDMLLGCAAHESEYAPNTFTTGLYVAVCGDWSYYHICDNLNFTVQRLVELYSETNQVGFISRFESDGMPAIENAFVRVKLA